MSTENSYDPVPGIPITHSMFEIAWDNPTKRRYKIVLIFIQICTY